MVRDQAVQTGPPKSLLCLDGGGVKGISSVMILQAIMKEIERIEDGPSTVIDQTKPGAAVATSSLDSNERKPIDYFDLTGGTSTGGIIAVMISRLGMNCTEAINVYKTISSDIFAVRVCGINISKIPIIDRLGPLVLKIKTLLGTQFSAKYMNRNIEAILAKHIGPDEPHDCKGRPYLVDDDRYFKYDARGKMLMCATMADRGKALLFRNYTPPTDAIPETNLQYKDQNPPPAAPPYPDPCAVPPNPTTRDLHLHQFVYKHVTIEGAVRATSAAPTYLPPKLIQHITFWDGGCLNNNPIDQVWAARYDLTPNCHAEPYVQTVLSIGTTYSSTPTTPPTSAIGRLLRILNKSLDFMTNTEAKHMDFKRNIYRRNLRQPKDQRTCYFRLNASTGATSVNLADYKQIPFLEKITNDYLDLPETKCKVRQCAELLAKRRYLDD